MIITGTTGGCLNVHATCGRPWLIQITGFIGMNRDQIFCASLWIFHGIQLLHRLTLASIKILKAIEQTFKCKYVDTISIQDYSKDLRLNSDVHKLFSEMLLLLHFILLDMVVVVVESLVLHVILMVGYVSNSRFWQSVAVPSLLLSIHEL